MTTTVEIIDPTPRGLSLPLAPVRYTTATEDVIEAKRAYTRHLRAMHEAVHTAKVRPAKAPPKAKKPRQEREPRPRLETIRPCTACGTLTRPNGTTVDQHHGTLRRGTRDLCDACHKARREGRERRDPDQLRPCEGGCGRTTRPTRWTPEKARYWAQDPDLVTVPRLAAGKCGKCVRGHDTQPDVRPCTGCGYPTRPAGRTKEEFRDTRKRQGKGLCTTCYFRARKAAA